MSDLILNEQQREALIGAHCSIKFGLDALTLLVACVEDVIDTLAPDEKTAEIYRSRTEALNYIIATIERDLEDANEVYEPDHGFRAMRKHKEASRKTATLNGGGAHV
jgi:hypothetical protein